MRFWSQTSAGTNQVEAESAEAAASKGSRAMYASARCVGKQDVRTVTRDGEITKTRFQFQSYGTRFDVIVWPVTVAAR